jgi:hypothetical protein
MLSKNSQVLQTNSLLDKLERLGNPLLQFREKISFDRLFAELLRMMPSGVSEWKSLHHFPSLGVGSPNAALLGAKY